MVEQSAMAFAASSALLLYQRWLLATGDIAVALCTESPVQLVMDSIGSLHIIIRGEF